MTLTPETSTALSRLAWSPAEVEVHEPGTIRAIHYWSGRGPDGRYPVTYWGTLEEQIAAATAENLVAHSSIEHTMMRLYLMVEDCGHTNPDGDARFDGVDDLVDEWMARNCPGLDRSGRFDSVELSLYYRNRNRAGIIPLVAEYWAADAWYSDTHSTVCLEKYMGDCCEKCADFDPDFGAEPAACRRQDDAREAQAEFWDRFSDEAIQYLAKTRAAEGA